MLLPIAAADPPSPHGYLVVTSSRPARNQALRSISLAMVRGVSGQPSDAVVAAAWV
jgi:hypothetical protein